MYVTEGISPFHHRGVIRIPCVPSEAIPVQQERAGQSESKQFSCIIIYYCSVLYTCDIDTGGSDDGSYKRTVP